MKKLIMLGLFAALAAGTIEARGGHGGGHRGGHGRYRGGHGYRRGWGGGWNRGWGGFGFGPSVGFNVPIGGGKPTAPGAVREYNRINGNPSNYRPSVNAFCNWAKDYFNESIGQRRCNEYESFLRNAGSEYSSQPSGSISFGIGGGYGGPFRRGWW